MMLNPCGDEQEVARLKGVTLAVVKEAAPAASDDVNFVLVVRRLFVRARWSAKYDVQSGAFKNADGTLARRYMGFNFGKSHYTATVLLLHVRRPPEQRLHRAPTADDFHSVTDSSP